MIITLADQALNGDFATGDCFGTEFQISWPRGSDRLTYALRKQLLGGRGLDEPVIEDSAGSNVPHKRFREMDRSILVLNEYSTCTFSSQTLA